MAHSLLTIQKFIYLLDNFHYREFTAYLSSVNASLPLKLVEAIRNKLPGFDTHEILCKKVYGSFDKTIKQNFNQLSSYTFRLSSVLAHNSPGYLHINIPLIEQLVNEGKREEANIMAEALLEIAGRIEDSQCHISALKFLSQQAFLVKDIPAGLKLHAELDKVLDKERLMSALQAKLMNALHTLPAVKDPGKLKELKLYFGQYFSHSSPGVRIYSRFAFISLVYDADMQLFEQGDISKIIHELTKELHNQAHVVFPFLVDIKGSVGFMKLNSPLTRLNSKEGEKEYEDLNEHYNSIKFWRSYLSLWQLHLIAIQITRLLTTYHYQVHRDDYRKIIAPNDWRWIKSLLEKCDELTNTKIFKEHYEFEIRSLKMMHGALLILSGGSNIKKGIEDLESMLITYQQANLKGSTDSIFLCLMVGYFSSRNYIKCVSTFRRYNKIIKGKPVFSGNDVKIHAYYYLSQWIYTSSKQYTVKMQSLIKNYEGGPPPTIVELINYFKMPVGKI